MKECPRCKTVKQLEKFKSDKLITGYGRHCNECKEQGEKPFNVEKNPIQELSDTKCPLCSAGMIMRMRRRDSHKFYGCSRYPRCRGTRSLIS